MPGISATEPEKISGIGRLSGAAPHRIFTPWFSSMMIPKVAIT